MHETRDGSNIIVEPVGAPEAIGGLEQELLMTVHRAAKAQAEQTQPDAQPEGFFARLGNKLNSDDPSLGLRSLALHVNNGSDHPFTRLSGYPLTQLHQAGLADTKGRMFPKVVIKDEAGVAKLRPLFDELRAARRETMQTNSAPAEAAIADGLYTYSACYRTGTNL